MNPLEQRIGYKFRNSLLLAEALTHPSLGHETQRHHFDNQRLEFLGDAVLQLIFTEHLFRLFPHFSEGQLTKLRSRLVSREGLKVHSINIGLGTYLMMGRGEEASGGVSAPRFWLTRSKPWSARCIWTALLRWSGDLCWTRRSKISSDSHISRWRSIRKGNSRKYCKRSPRKARITKYLSDRSGASKAVCR